MTPDDIIKMAEQAGFEFTAEGHLILRGADWHTEECVQTSLARFAALVAASEREACKEICVDDGALGLAAAIRARGEE